MVWILFLVTDARDAKVFVHGTASPFIGNGVFVGTR
jgi:hypothetical protein